MEFCKNFAKFNRRLIRGNNFVINFKEQILMPIIVCAQLNRATIS